MKTKFNYIFFIFFLAIPLFAGIVVPIVLWPIAFNTYVSKLYVALGIPYSELSTFVESILLSMILMTVVLVYVGIPYIIKIKEDRIIFYRMLRKKIKIDIGDIAKMEILRKLPPTSRGSSNLLFHLKNKSKIPIIAIPNSIADKIGDIAKRNGIEVYEEMRRLTDEEWAPLKGGN